MSLLLGVLVAGAAAATGVVYHSPGDDGADPGLPVELAGLPLESLYLYADAGPLTTAVGSACLDGDGDEICAYRFCIETQDLVSILAFDADPAQDVVSNLAATRLCASGGDATLGQLGPVRIGELVVAASGAGTVEVVEGRVVAADLTLGSVAPRVLAVPEPGLGVQLGVGLGFLAVVGRRRGRSR